jgi:hypothetical protein
VGTDLGALAEFRVSLEKRFVEPDGLGLASGCDRAGEIGQGRIFPFGLREIIRICRKRKVMPNRVPIADSGACL